MIISFCIFPLFQFLLPCGIYVEVLFQAPVTVAGRSRACTVFARSEAGIVGSNPSQCTDVWCVCVCFSVFVLSYV
jgi:hypothetical protein